MSKQLRADWKRFLETGGYCTPPGRAACALASARTLAQWRELEAAGTVRLVAEPEQESYFDVYGDPEGYEGRNGRRVSADQARKELEEQLEDKGCWWLQAEYLTPEGQWEQADSIGMCAGYDDPLDPFQNDYVVSLMHSAIVACSDAWELAGEAV